MRVAVQDFYTGFKNHLEEKYKYNTYRAYNYAALEFSQYMQEKGQKLDIKENKVYDTTDLIRDFYKQTQLHNTKTNGIRRFLEYIATEIDSSKHGELIQDISDKVTYNEVQTLEDSAGLTKEEVQEKLLTQDEFQKALNVSDMREKVMISMLLDTGCRAGELAALTWNDIKPVSEGTAPVQITKTYVSGHGVQKVPKSKAGRRSVELLPETYSLLQDYKDMEDIDDDERFFSTYSIVYRNVKESFANAGIRPTTETSIPTEVTPHWIRHNTATLLAKDGVSKEDVNSYMGHKKMETTEIYMHFSETDVVGVYQKREGRGSLLS